LWLLYFTILADDEYWFEYDYYLKLNQELGDRFSQSLNEVIDGVAHNPFLCHNRGNGIYSVRVKGFPSSLFYGSSGEFVGQLTAWRRDEVSSVFGRHP